MFMSEYICIMVDLFDKAVAEGRDNHCGNEIGRSSTTGHSYIYSHTSIALVGSVLPTNGGNILETFQKHLELVFFHPGGTP